MTDEEWETRRFYYAGRRYTGSKILHVMSAVNDPDDVAAFKKGPPGLFIGGMYEVEIRTDSARIQSATWLSREPKSDRAPDWRLKDQAAGIEQERDRALRRMRKENADIGNLTLREIRTMIAAQPRHVKNGTIQVVTNYLST